MQYYWYFMQTLATNSNFDNFLQILTTCDTSTGCSLQVVQNYDKKIDDPRRALLELGDGDCGGDGDGDGDWDW